MKHCDHCFAATLNMRPKHWDILRELAKGKGNKQIAHQLGLQEKTVKNYLTMTYHLLNVQTRLEAVIYLFKHHLITADEL